MTRGDPHEHETRCAIKVARRLGFDHRVLPNDPGGTLRDTETRVTWEHCAAGFSGTGGWSGSPDLRALGTHAVSGHSLDWILTDGAPSGMKMSFDAFFDHHNRWGVSPAVLERLLRREVFGDAVREVMASLRRPWEGYAREDYRRALCYALQHRQRFHIGGLSWPQTFGAWPITPAVDRKLLAVAFGLPHSTLLGRELQNQVLCRRFPRLASLPLDRNSDNITPLLPGIGWRVRRRLLLAYRRFVPERGPRVERRRYFSSMDINGPSWNPVREAAEPHRRLGHEFFHPDVLDELLPPPAARPEYRDPITGPAGMKTLMGFLMWLGRA